MPDTNTLNIMKININSIGAEQARGNNKCCTNIHTLWGSSQSRKQSEELSATQTWTAFQNQETTNKKPMFKEKIT